MHKSIHRELPGCVFSVFLAQVTHFSVIVQAKVSPANITFTVIVATLTVTDRLFALK